MIIELLSNKNNNINVSAYSHASDAIKGKVWSYQKPTDFVWVMGQNRRSLSITTSFGEKVRLKEIVFNADHHVVDDGSRSVSGVNHYVYEVSQDNVVWEELPFKRLGENSVDYYYRFLDTYQIELDEKGRPTGPVYRRYLKSTVLSDLNQYGKCTLLSEHNQSDADNINEVILYGDYIFKDKNGNYIYGDLDVNFVRVTFKNLQVIQDQITGEWSDFIMKEFKIYGEETIDEIKEPLLTLTAGRLFLAEYFQNKLFMPDQIGTWLKMLESNSFYEKQKYDNLGYNSFFDFDCHPAPEEFNTDIIVDDFKTFDFYLSAKIDGHVYFIDDGTGALISI